jgi:DNA-binding IclR family transcriptional regulator
LPAFCTASGKAILAFVSDDQVKRALERGMPRYTSTTPTSQEGFLEDMIETRKRGFAISEQQFEDGINVVTVPISHPLIAALSIARPAYRLTNERMFEIGSDLLATAKNH